MAINMIPWGRLQNGNYGVLVEAGTNRPLASVIEVLTTLPSAASADNFPGRAVFSTTDSTIYVFTTDPTPQWISLEGIPARVGAVAGIPPVIPTPLTGELFWDTDTEVMFVWDGSAWNPIGGRYAAQMFVEKYIGDGVTLSFPMGTTGTVSSEYVEVYLDGVRQVPNPSGDYSIIGTNVVFGAPVPLNVVILIRSTVSSVMTQNTQVSRESYTATAGQTTFSVGVPSADPASTFVFVDGLQKTLNTDYTHNSLDTTITSIAKISATTARAMMAVAHGMAVGFPLTIAGAAESAYNATFTVTNVPTATQVDFTVDGGDPASATPDPILYYTPSYINDTIVMTLPLSGGEKVEIRTFKNVLVAPSQGEANTLTSLGTGTGLDAGKAGDVLQLKSLKAGSNVSISSNSTEVTINVSSALSFEDRVGINSTYYLVNSSESYVGVRNTTMPVTIDLSGITASPVNSGRRITVMDESGSAILNNITVSTGGPLIDGGTGIYVINTNYGCVSLVMDGTNWYIISEKT